MKKNNNAGIEKKEGMEKDFRKEEYCTIKCVLMHSLWGGED